jgi:serine/threonine protein kinase
MYRLLNRDYHESFDFYVPQLADFHQLVSNQLLPGWEITRSGIWFHCSSAQNILPDQGWKIHISATRANARQLLDRVSSLLFAAGDTDFKFALDLQTLYLLNGKNWPRGASGKFITIYPADNSRFLELIEAVHLATREFQGPYILSDHRYKDSNVVFYRYGGLRQREALDVNGERTPVLVAPDGTECPDRRLPYPQTPVWVDTVLPLEQECEAGSESYCIGERRFQIDGVIAFSSSGGVYRGLDLKTGARVVIKEARPCIEVTDGFDAVMLLKKEHRLLVLLADTGIAPQPVELVQEGSHWFLVEEQVQGVSLSAHSASNNILLRTRATEGEFESWYQMFRKLALKLLEILEILQSRNVVFSDLSPNNLIVSAGGEDLKLVDFEGAHQLGVDPPTSLSTLGFVSPRRREGVVASFADDLYAAGAVLLSYLLPVNEFFHLQPSSRERFLCAVQRDARLPGGVARLIEMLMEPDAQPLAGLKNIVETLPTCCSSVEEAEEGCRDYAGVIDGIAQHLLHTATYARRDRLFPADPKLFSTNPLSLAYGAAGSAYAIKKITGLVPRSVSDWIVKYPVTPDKYAPGFYLGLSGIAWVLLELGERQHAEDVFRLSFDHTLLSHSRNLFHGSAGWGMTSLRFFLATGDEIYLQKGIRCGDRLLAAGDKQSSSTDTEMLGLGHGASGIALFLLYLYLVTREERFLSAGRQMLATELAAGIRTRDGGLSWKAGRGSPDVLYPYWRYGSAGIGTAVVRYEKVVGDGSYRDALEGIFIDTDRKHALLPGRFMGLAGIGDFLLDAWTFTGDDKYLQSAHRVAQGVMAFSVNREGIAFPGDSLSRLSCDYGTGSAGIALFLNRLLGRQGSDFLLDELLGISEGASFDLSKHCEAELLGEVA